MAFHGIARVDVRQLPVHEGGGGIQKPRGFRGDRDLPSGEHGHSVPGQLAGRTPPVRGDAADEPLRAPADHLVDRPRSEVSFFGEGAAAGISLVGDVVRVRHLIIVVLVVVVIVVVIVIIVVVDVDDDVGDGGGADDDEGEEAHGGERAWRGSGWRRADRARSYYCAKSTIFPGGFEHIKTLACLYTRTSLKQPFAGQPGRLIHAFWISRHTIFNF